MLPSDEERSLVDPLTVILSPNTKPCRDRLGAVSISRDSTAAAFLEFLLQGAPTSFSFPAEDKRFYINRRRRAIEP